MLSSIELICTASAVLPEALPNFTLQWAGFISSLVLNWATTWSIVIRAIIGALPFFFPAVSDNFDERIEQKIFHAEIVVDNEQVKRETAGYKKLPQIIDFRDEDGNDRMQEEIQANYNRVKQEVQQIVTDEMERIKNDPDLQHLIKEE